MGDNIILIIIRPKTKMVIRLKLLFKFKANMYMILSLNNLRAFTLLPVNSIRNTLVTSYIYKIIWESKRRIFFFPGIRSLEIGRQLMTLVP